MIVNRIIKTNELAKKMHDSAVKKGFYDKKPSNVKLILLIITEISEFYEHYRCKERANIKAARKAFTNGSDFNAVFYSYIKNTAEEEIADIIIRILDFIGFLGWEMDDIEFPLNGVKAENEEYLENKTFELITDITSIIIKNPKNMNFNDKLLPKTNVKITLIEMLLNLVKISRYLNFDVFEVIDWKYRYNQSRPYKHNKQFWGKNGNWS